MKDGAAQKEICFLDVEAYGNAALFMARTQTGRLFKRWFTRRDDAEAMAYVGDVMAGPYIFVTFRGWQYDLVIVDAMLGGRGPHEIKHVSNRVIEGNLASWDARKEFKLKEHLLALDHIDLEGAKPPFVGLKMCGARMGAPRIIENPMEHQSSIKETDFPAAEAYCVNDLDLTEMLFNKLEKPLLLRCSMSREIGVDLRSKTDSQMAEALFKAKLNLGGGRKKIPPTVTYKAPGWAHGFKHPVLVELVQKLEAETFRVHQGHGHVIMPDWLNLRVESATGKYQMGVGGLHSVHDKKVCHVAGDGWVVDDVDWDSYYPTLIVNADPSILPPHLGEAFIGEYDGVRVVRLDAKRVKDMSKADSLRIAVNGTFGKLMSFYSPLYAPALGLYTVLTGQLGLLGAIFEAIEPAGGIVLSANTDGIVIKHRDDDGVMEAVRAYVKRMSLGARAEFGIEETRYRCIAMKDVNNYMAVKAKDRTIKAKGLYATLEKLMKNPTLPVCSEAVGKWLSEGTPFEETLKAAYKRQHMPDWLAARNVTGGGQQNGKFVGKVVRWYLSTDEVNTPLTYVTNGNKIPKTEGVRACMVYDPAAPLPEDLDYNSYLKETVRIAADLGASEYLTDEQRALIAKPLRAPRRKKANIILEKEAA